MSLPNSDPSVTDRALLALGRARTVYRWEEAQLKRACVEAFLSDVRPSDILRQSSVEPEFWVEDIPANEFLTGPQRWAEAVAFDQSR